jgi:hypothetical protein
MTRYGAQFGPDITFLGVDRVDLEDGEALSGLAARKVGITHDPAGPLLEGRGS